MSWHKLKKYFDYNKPEESHFVLGINLGNETSSISFFDFEKLDSETIDISSGYGNPSIPTVARYISQTDDFIYGEYALFESADSLDIKIENLISLLGQNYKLKLSNKDIKLKYILAGFIKDLIESCKNINPKAIICGIVVSTADDLSEMAKQELEDAFLESGYADFVIEYVLDIESAFSKYFHKNSNISKKILFLDLSYRQLRAGIYTKDIQKKNTIICNSYMKDDDLGEISINRDIINYIYEYIIKKNPQNYEKKTDILEQIKNFIRLNKQIIFKNILSKDTIKVYYNFLYPPIEHVIKSDDILRILDIYKSKIKKFFENLFERYSDYDLNKIGFDDIEEIICTGGSFEMNWIKIFVENIFYNLKINFYKNSKTIISEGAAILAASKFNLIEDGHIFIIDNIKTNKSIGLMLCNNFEDYIFYDCIKKGTYWWEKISPAYIILKDDLIQSSYDLNIYTKCNNNICLLKNIKLKNLPNRSKYTIRLKISFEFLKVDKLNILVEDCGFGEIFKKTKFYQNFEIDYII